MGPGPQSATPQGPGRILLIAGIVSGLIVAGVAGYLIASPSEPPLATLVFAANVKNVSGEWSTPLVIAPSLEHHLLSFTTWVNISGAFPGCAYGFDYSWPCSFWLNYSHPSYSSNPINLTNSYPLAVVIPVAPGDYTFTVLVLECSSFGGHVSCSKANYDLVVKILDLGLPSEPI